MLSSTVTDLASVLSEQVASGATNARASMSEKTQAFAWAGGIANGLVAYVDTALSGSTQFTTTRVLNSSDPVAYPGSGDKPVTATLEAVPTTLKMYPGVCTITTRDILNSANLGAAVANSLHRQAQRALDKDLVTAIIADDNTTLAKAASLATIVEAQGIILEQGGSPNLVALSAADYATIFGASTGIIGLGGNDPQSPLVSIAGSRVVISSALATGEALVLDSSSVLAVEQENSPIVLLDTHARANTVDIVVEVVAAAVVSSPDLIVHVKAGTK